MRGAAEVINKVGRFEKSVQNSKTRGGFLGSPMLLLAQYEPESELNEIPGFQAFELAGSPTSRFVYAL